ncbi:hypothetical protein BST61_g11464 [Cercospora zeina]
MATKTNLPLNNLLPNDPPRNQFTIKPIHHQANSPPNNLPPNQSPPMPRLPTTKRLRRDLAQDAIDEFTSSIVLERTLLVHWRRAHQDAGRGELDYVELLGSQAADCRARRRYLMDNFKVSQQDMARHFRVLHSWKAALDAALKDEINTTGVDITAMPSRRKTWLQGGLEGLAVAFGMIAILAVLGQALRSPVPLTHCTAILERSTPSTNVTERMSQRLWPAEQYLNSCASNDSFPEAQHACVSGQAHMAQVRELWVESSIFHEPLAIDLHTATTLEKIASEDTWMPWLDLVAYYDLPFVPAAWTAQCTGVRMAAVLAEHRAKKVAWARRAQSKVEQGKGHILEARRHVQDTQAVWLPIEAKEAVTSQVHRVSKAFQESLVLCGRLEALERHVGEDDMSIVEEGAEGVDGPTQMQMQRELLSHSQDSLRRWAEVYRAGAECRLEAGCQSWVHDKARAVIDLFFQTTLSGRLLNDIQPHELDHLYHQIDFGTPACDDGAEHKNKANLLAWLKKNYPEKKQAGARMSTKPLVVASMQLRRGQEPVAKANMVEPPSSSGKTSAQRVGQQKVPLPAKAAVAKSKRRVRETSPLFVTDDEASDSDHATFSEEEEAPPVRRSTRINTSHHQPWAQQDLAVSPEALPSGSSRSHPTNSIPNNVRHFLAINDTAGEMMELGNSVNVFVQQEKWYAALDLLNRMVALCVIAKDESHAEDVTDPGMAWHIDDVHGA